MGMFANLGMTLSLLREIRGKSQSRVAREARIGKSQLSKYENGRELPKLDSPELGKLAVFSGVSEFPIRVKCATLSWHTLRAALKGNGEVVSTE